MAPSPDSVFATLMLGDSYLPGAMVLAHSLRDRGAKGRLIVLVTADTVSPDTITELETMYNEVIPVNDIPNRAPANLYLMDRPDLISTFTKIELWRQTQYQRIVYLDADMVCLQAPNDLLTLDTDFAAVPDIGWPDCFNSGLMVLNPNLGDYYSMLAMATRGVSFDGADQGLLNTHFRDWERLSFAYNCTPSGNYQYIPAYRHFQSTIRMVHFIGKDKPWTLGRDNKYSSGVYGELLAMWWAVYDRYYRLPESAHYSGQYQGARKKVQDYVKGEETTYGYSSAQPQSPERPMGDHPTPSEQVLEDDFKPIPTAEVRRFSAPHVEWEPSRAPPPTGSKPEASNFPSQIYDMTSDTKLFEPPSKYPEPPKGMWYQVPERSSGPSNPKPIFPWEAHAPKATRVFPRADPPSPDPMPEPAPQNTRPGETDINQQTEEESASTPTVSSPDPWAGFQQRSNAWDDVPEIEKYVQAVNQSRKGKIQVLHHTPTQSGARTPPGQGRRPSTKLTDFPTEIERPSLPVTPAPIRRPSFWGEERDEAGDLPAAAGVPKQEEWNPIAKLEELQRRQSEVLNAGVADPSEQAKDHPTREMPESQSQAEAEKKAISPEKAPHALKSILKEPKIGRLPEDEASPPNTNEDTSKGPSFNPIALVGEAATEKKSAASRDLATVEG